MALFVRAAPKRDWPWLVAKTECALTTDFTAIEAIEPGPDYANEPEDYRVRGMVGFCNTTLNAMQVHIAVDSPVVWRALLVPGLEYPFQQCNKRVLIGVIPAGNTKSVRFAKHVGFVETHRVRDGWAEGEDLVLLELRREESGYFKRLERAA